MASLLPHRGLRAPASLKPALLDWSVRNIGVSPGSSGPGFVEAPCRASAQGWCGRLLSPWGPVRARDRLGDIAIVPIRLRALRSVLEHPPGREVPVRTRRHARNRRAAEAGIRRAVRALLRWRSGTRINGPDLAKPPSIARRAASRTMRDRAPISPAAKETSRESARADGKNPGSGWSASRARSAARSSRRVSA
jgi:hypothetical protein